MPAVAGPDSGRSPGAGSRRGGRSNRPTRERPARRPASRYDPAVRLCLSPTDVSSRANPILDMWFQMATTVDDDNTGTVQSILTNPSALSFKVFAEQSDGAMALLLTKTSDLVADQIQDPLTGTPQPGHYAAAFAASDLSPQPAIGSRCEIVWTWTMPNGATGTAFREFDFLPQPSVAHGYCLPSDLRAEGFSRARFSDSRLLRLIQLESGRIDRITNRFFEPRYQSQTLNGTGGRAMQLGDPIIALQLVTLGNPVVNTIQAESFRVFNRHITAGILSPDDRQDPKIEFVHYRDIFGRQRSASIDSPLFGVPFRDLFFPAGVQNVNITALFGYTDPDGSCTGGTPELIRHACKLLVAKQAYKLGDDSRDEAKRHRIVSEGTRDQRYQLQEVTEGALTGDREVDDILLSFIAPLTIGAA